MSPSEPPVAEGAAHPPNRLAGESSPYLLQHARNPVDWWPWSAEAIEEARRRDVPILVSIGYSTCYWCHVMERESFEDPEVAAFLNEHFLPIKVDREQRPDVDDIYMTACQIYTQLTEGRPSGGWPLNAFLDPKTLEPFVVGTYFPPKPMHGRPSFENLLESLADAWTERRSEVEAQAGRIGELVRGQLDAASSVEPLTPALRDDAVTALLRYHDAEEGGFGGAPKFPQPVYLEFLFDAAGGRDDVAVAIARTLDRMAVGGIHDQVAGGFHRYAVDGTWTVPHFEKMLYDNGQLASAYATSVERTGDPYHEEVLRDLLEYVLREMTEADGAFRSAQDAEVDAREGGSHVWRPAEVAEALREGGLENDVDFTLEAYGLSEGPNFQDPHHPEEPASNVLRLRDRPEVVAGAMGVDPAAFTNRLREVDAVLLSARDQRPQPGLDDKILASWNGMMIRGFADAGRVLGEPRYLEAAAAAARAVRDRLLVDDVLFRSVRGDVRSGPGFLDDYALMAEGMLALHAATDDPQWLDAARELVALARGQFRDANTGRWFDTREGQDDLLVRASRLDDGAVPSGGGTMMQVLATLAERTGEPRHLEDLYEFLRASSSQLAGNPLGPLRAMLALDRFRALAPDRAEALSIGDPDAKESETGGVGAGDPVDVTLERTANPDVATLVFRIPEGFHINAHDPGDSEAARDLQGLRLEVLEGGDVRPRWPRGTPWRDGILVHEGVLEVPIDLRFDDSSPAMRIVVEWQTCDERVCYRPVSRTIEIRMDPQP